MRGTMLAPWLLLAGLSGYALLGTRSPSSEAPPSKEAKSPSAKVVREQTSLGPLWTALWELRDEVASLQANVDARPAEARSAPPTESEVQSHEDRYLSVLEINHELEPVDDAWADETESAAAAWFDQEGVEADLVEVNCRSRSCRAVFAASSLESRAVLFDTLPMTAPFNSAGHFSSDPEDPLVVELWFSREGQDLPAPG